MLPLLPTPRRTATGLDPQTHATVCCDHTEARRHLFKQPWIISASADFGFKAGFRQNARRPGMGHRSGATTPAIPNIERTV
jgi:hypothetical protein